MVRVEMGVLAYGVYRLGKRIARSQLMGSLIPTSFRSIVQAGLLPSAIHLLPDPTVHGGCAVAGNGGSEANPATQRRSPALF